MPWWKHRLYIEGLMEEFYDEEVPSNGIPGDGSAADLEAAGFTVRSE